MTKPLVDTFELCGQVLDTKFRLENAVAEGGFGVVYAGHHLGLDVPVAVKVLKTPPDLSERARADFVQSFVLEAKTIAKLQHPAIVHVLDTGVTTSKLGPAAYMVLEWLEGETLATTLARRRHQGGQSPSAVLASLHPVFDALAYAHESGIVHRDIKPANIMMVPTRRGPSAKVLDFGIAKLMGAGEEAGSGQTRTSNAFSAFSAKYASPEQIGNARTGPWTDVHALGLMVTEMLVDEPPYRGATSTELVQDATLPVRPTPGKFGYNAGPLEPVLRMALAFRPEDRYRNAGELLTALERAVAEMAAGAHHPLPRVPGNEVVDYSGPIYEIPSGSGPGATTMASIVRANAASGTVSPRVSPPAIAGAAMALVGAVLGVMAWVQHARAPASAAVVRPTGAQTPLVAAGPAQPLRPETALPPPPALPPAAPTELRSTAETTSPGTDATDAGTGVLRIPAPNSRAGHPRNGHDTHYRLN